MAAACLLGWGLNSHVSVPLQMGVVCVAEAGGGLAPDTALCAACPGEALLALLAVWFLWSSGVLRQRVVSPGYVSSARTLACDGTLSFFGVCFL